MDVDVLDGPRVRASRIAGSRRAYIELLADGDLCAEVGPSRYEVLLLADGGIDWTSTRLAGERQ